MTTDVPPASLRILHIAESYPPVYGGGAAVTTREICQALARRGHEVRVLCCHGRGRDAYSLDREADGAVLVQRISLPYFETTDPNGWWLPWREFESHRRRVAGIVRQMALDWRPDLVDYHTSRPLGEGALLALHELGIPVVATLHDAWLICPRVMLLRSPHRAPCPGPAPLRCAHCLYSNYESPRLNALALLPWRLYRLGLRPLRRLRQRKEARRRLAGAVARSRFMARVHQGRVGGLMEHIEFGVDLSDLPLRRPARPRSPMVFGFVAGSHPTKGLPLLLRAAASLNREGHTFALHLWGPDLESVPAQLEERGLAGVVQVRGMYAHEDRWGAYQAMDVAIMATTVSEPLGRVPLEAAAAGVPTIAPDIGGIPESVEHGVSGLLFPFGDADGLKRQMQRVLEEPGLYAGLAGNLRTPVSTPDAAVSLERFYRSVLGPARR